MSTNQDTAMKKASAELQVFWVITFNIDIKRGMYCVKLSHYYVVILQAAINCNKIEVRIVQAIRWGNASPYFVVFFLCYSDTVDLCINNSAAEHWWCSFSRLHCCYFPTTYYHRSDFSESFHSSEFDGTTFHSGLGQLW